jgi:DNA-binding transcriptional LysR family regulator
MRDAHHHGYTEAMNIRQLEAFVAVAETLHFGRAAERLHLSQSALSRQITQLEQELGVVLLRRSRHGVELHPAGHAYLRGLREPLRLLERASDLARRTERGEAGELRIGHVDSSAYELLPAALRRFREARPAVSLTVEEASSGVILNGLIARRLDVGLVRPPIHPHVLQHQLVVEEPFVLALQQDHPLADHQTVELRALAGEDLVIPPRREVPELHDRIVQLCVGAGFTPNLAYEATPLASVLPVVAAGLGVALVPDGLSRHFRAPGLIYRPLHEQGATLELHVAWRRDDDAPLVRAFVDQVARLRPTLRPLVDE